MRFHHLKSIILLWALLAGCATGHAGGNVPEGFIGVRAERFFTTWGGPVTSRRTEKGGRVYLWFSGRGSPYRPGERGTADLTGNTAWWKGYTLPGYSPMLECRLEILTGRKGRIVAIRMFGERHWQHRQRCREVFGPGWSG